MPPKKIIIPNIDIETLADKKDFKIKFGPLEAKESHKYMRVFWIDGEGNEWPIHLLMKNMKVRFPYSRDTRKNVTRTKYNMGVELEEERTNMKRGFERLNDLLIEQIVANKHLIYDEPDEMEERDIRKLYFPIASYKKKKGTKKHVGKIFDPTLTLHARMVLNPETNESEPRLTVIDTNKVQHDPSELTYGSLIDVIARVSHLWIATKSNCNLQMLKVGCKQFGKVQQEEAEFDWEEGVAEPQAQTEPQSVFNFAEDFEGNSAMMPMPINTAPDIPTIIETKTSPKRPSPENPAPRPRKRARTSS